MKYSFKYFDELEGKNPKNIFNYEDLRPHNPYGIRNTLSLSIIIFLLKALFHKHNRFLQSHPILMSLRQRKLQEKLEKVSKMMIYSFYEFKSMMCVITRSTS